ncbi:Fc.00g022640.m01.CDS01 [Cosmosporella sp. VM-42]
MSIPGSSSSILTPPKSQEYMDSLVPPTADGYERIASVQKEREEEQKRRTKEKRQSLKSQHSRGGSISADSVNERTQAARMIQKTFRGYRARREMQGFSLDPNTRWVTAIREAQFREMNRPRARSKVDPGSVASLGIEASSDQRPMTARDNWRKVSAIARRAGHDDLLSDSSSSESEDENASPEERAAARAQREKANVDRKDRARMMGLQYFLEMVDLKHRYGSNLRMYHEEWKKANTNENFFYWLDYGEGKNIELDTCPRDRLAREQVRYLSREERQYYLVDIDEEGRLCWAKNGERIDTTEKYKDSIHGVVPSDDPTPAFNAIVKPETSLGDNSTSSRSSLESEREADRAAKYTNSIDNNQGMKKVTHISASTIFNKMLRKSVKKNTWIFVADTSFRLYVGIKNSGAFQHSSFLQGSRISAAGLIKVKNGRLSSLSPLSGHYRPPASNFRAFVRSLKEDGVDMSHVSISKSYAVLVGLEAYVKTRRKGKDLVRKILHGKDKLVDPEEVKRKEEEQRDKSQSAEKERKFIQKEEKERDENRTSMRVKQKLGIVPIREPDGQR